MVTLSIIIPAFNEERVIRSKLDDIYTTRLARGSFEVLVGSDGSTDRTAEYAIRYGIEHAYDNLRIFSFVNEGKAATLTKLVRLCSGAVIIGTDADAHFGNPALFEYLIGRFSRDPHLGGISCVPDFSTNAVERGYWSVEHAIRSFLSNRGMLFVVTGMGFAFRASAADPVPSDIMADDLWLPLSILKNGFSVVSDDRFHSSTDIFSDERELKRKIRVIKGGMQCLLRFFSRYPRMLLTPIFLCVLVFKVSKWSLPFICSAGLLAISTSRWSFAVSILVICGVGIALSKPVRYAIFGIFLPVVALWQTMTGPSEARWRHVR